jgi:hypothetical protein
MLEVYSNHTRKAESIQLGLLDPKTVVSVTALLSLLENLARVPDAPGPLYGIVSDRNRYRDDQYRLTCCCIRRK